MATLKKTDYAVLSQLAFVVYAVLIAPKIIQWAFIVLLDDEPFVLLGVLLMAALIIEPIAMWVLVRRRRIAHRMLGAIALIAHMLSSVFVYFIALEAFGMQIEEGPGALAMIGMIVLILKDIFLYSALEAPESWRKKPNLRKEAWAEAGTFFFSAMVFATFWGAGIASIPLDETNLITKALSLLVLMFFFVIIYMSSNMAAFLMNETGEFSRKVFIRNLLSSIAIAAIPFLFEFM